MSQGSENIFCQRPVSNFLGFASQSDSVAINQLLQKCASRDTCISVVVLNNTLFQNTCWARAPYMELPNLICPPCSTEQTSVLCLPCISIPLLWVKQISPLRTILPSFFKCMEYVTLTTIVHLTQVDQHFCPLPYPQMPVSSRMKT